MSGKKTLNGIAEIRPLRRLYSRQKTLHTLATIGLLLLLGWGGAQQNSYASGGWVGKNGVVATRGLVLGPNGQPIFAEFDNNGVAHAISGLPNNGEAIGELSDARIMSADIYRAYVAAYKNFMQQHEGGIARGATIKTREEYRTYQNVVDNIDVPLTDGLPFLEAPVPKPDLRDATRSVLVRNHETIIDPRLLPTYGEQRGVILFESPIDLRPGNVVENLSANVSSVLLNNTGQIVVQSQNNLGFRAAWTQPREGGIGDPTKDNSLGELKPPYPPLWGPVSFTRIETPMYTKGPHFSDEEGKFRVRSYVPMCPGFSHIYEYNLAAWLAYISFDPQDPLPVRYYPFTAPTHDVCVGYGETGSPGSLVGAMVMLNLRVQSMFANLGGGTLRPVEILVDTVLLNGDAIITNDGTNSLPIAPQTSYQMVVPVASPMATNYLDIDSDRQTDMALLNGTNVDVYLGDNSPVGVNDQGQSINAAGNVVTADLQRVADYQTDFSDQGLLESISVEDFNNTDFFVYRVSNGDLVTQRQGMGDNAWLIENEGRFFYRILLPGPRAFRAGQELGQPIEEIQRDYQVEENLVGFNADFLRPGEQIQLVAINRATGYIGTSTATVDSGFLSKRLGVLDFAIERIAMRAPNLKIRAERMYTVTHGVTKGDWQLNQIGFEGGALKTDTFIALYTEWTAHDGSPLPSNLSGYTGRMAKVVANNTLGGNDVAFFNIKPGAHIQWLKVKGDIQGSEHFYIHVSGEHIDADFTECSANCGALQYRPKQFVPVRVPIFDEEATRQLRNTAGYLSTPVPASEVPAVYRWPYRPEMQFSVFDLNVKHINRTDFNGDITNVLDDDLPVIAGADLNAEVLYDLLMNQFDPLPQLGTPRDLVFTVGEAEQLDRSNLADANGRDATVAWNDLEHLNVLNGEDYLTVRLYQNNDTENVLWEFAFGLLPEAGPHDIELSADEPTIDLYAYFPGATGNNTNGQPKSISVRWSVQGPEGPGGTLAVSEEQSTAGIFTNTLTTSQNAGDEYTVTATILSSDDKRFIPGSQVQLGPYRVIPAEPNRIELAWPTGTLPADGTSTLPFTADVFDVYDNPVADDTRISWKIIDDADIDISTTTTETVNGQVTGTIRSGVVTGTFGVRILASNTATAQADITTTPVNLTLTASATTLTANTAETITLTAQAPNAADGTPVEWLSSLGVLDGDDVIQGGSATVTLSASENPGDGTVIANVGGQKAVVQINHVGASAMYATLQDAAIVGDASTDGFIDIEQWSGPSRSFAYRTSTNIILHGAPNEQIDLGIGSPNRPNSPPIGYFPLQGIDAGYIASADNLFRGMILGNITNIGNGLQFSGGHILLDDIAEFQITNNLFVNLDVSTDDGQPAVLVSQGSGATMGYELSLVQTGGQTYVQASIVTDTGLHTLTHTRPIAPNTRYKVGFRYINGVLELQVESVLTGSVEEIQALTVTGLIQNTTERIYLGQDLNGILSNLRIGQESVATGLLAFSGNVATQVTLDASGTATIPIQSNGNFTGSAQKVGITFRGAGATGQPLQLAQESVAESFLKFFFNDANAATRAEVRAAHRRGVAVVNRDTSGWFQSFVDRVNAIAEVAVDVAKVAGEIVSIITGIDDFIVLTKALMALAAGATDQIDLVEVTFAAVGAILTITSIVTLGVAATFVLPLKQGLGAFKLAIKSLNPTQIRAAFGMAKGLGMLFKEIVQKFQQNGTAAATVLVKDLAISVGFLVTNLTRPIFDIFIATIRSPLDFINWVKGFKLFNKTCLSASPSSTLYADLSTPSAIGKWLAAGALAFFISSAEAATSCDIAFAAAMNKADEIFQGLSAAQRTEKMAEFTDAIAQAQKYIRVEDGFEALQISEKAAEGMAKMILRGRNATNTRTVMRDIVKQPGLTDAQKNQYINNFFRMVSDLDDAANAVNVGNRFWGDLGKWVGNPGFLRGSYHTLDFMDDLRGANVTIESLEKGYNYRKLEGEDLVQRYVDIIAGGRKFELKNFSHYHGSNITSVTQGLEKELGSILKDLAGTTNPDLYIDEIKKIHFVFRGNPGGAETMLNKMLEVGVNQLDVITNPLVKRRVKEHFKDKMQAAISAASNGATKTVPALGDLVVFQGKTIPY